MLRTAFELTNDLAKASELRDAACSQLLPRDSYAVCTIEDLNDTSIGRGTILHLFDEYLEQLTPEPASHAVAEPVPAQEIPLPEPANDNQPEDLPATGTE